MKPAKDNDYYKILGVPEDASQAEIRRAFHKARRELPHDIEEARRKRALVNEAYSVLDNAAKRYDYDRAQLGRQKTRLQFVRQPLAAPSMIAAKILNIIQFITGKREVEPGCPSPESRVKLQVNRRPLLLMLLLLPIFMLAAAWPAVKDSVMPAGHHEPQVLTLDMARPELPPNGQTRYYRSEVPAVPLVIDSSAKETNYFIKLVDAAAGEQAVTIFIRGGERVETLVPPGYYELRYASGEEWYGEEFLFGEHTVYMKAYAKLDFYIDGGENKGRIISLTNQIDQGLHLKKIKQEEF